MGFKQGESAVEIDLINLLKSKLYTEREFTEVDDELPTLLEETSESLLGSILAYVIASMRKLARDGELNEDSKHLWQALLELPFSETLGFQLMSANLDAIKKEDSDLYFAAIERLAKDLPTVKAQIASASSGEEVSQVPEDSRYLIVFEDEDRHQEMVYGIIVERDNKRIKVMFRGSVTFGDFVTDGNSYLVSLPNPVFDEERERRKTTHVPQSRRIGIHRGFHHYLNREAPTPLVARGDSKNVKYDRIVQHLRRLLGEYPDYRILLCGHSLGGALATLCAFQLAATADDGLLPKPITCISIASPRVGNTQFFYAFQELEMQGKIRHLRVCNHNDIIPKFPDRLHFWFPVLSRRLYRHVGMKLELFPRKDKRKGRTHRIVLPRVDGNVCFRFLFDVYQAGGRFAEKFIAIPVGFFLDNYPTEHSCMEYLDRLESASTALQRLTLEDLYAKYRQIVASE